MLLRIFGIDKIKIPVRCFALITESMAKEKIVPDVISCSPEKRADVVFEGGIHVRDGTILTPQQVRHPPIVKWSGTCGCYYTVCMVDPDTPSRDRPECKELMHWLVVNAPAENLKHGETLFGYIGAIPGYGTGYHRYVVLVYEQGRKLYFDEPRISKRNIAPRYHFRIKEFARKHKLGHPIAGNFFKAQYDDCVPAICKQLCYR